MIRGLLPFSFTISSSCGSPKGERFFLYLPSHGPINSLDVTTTFVTIVLTNLADTPPKLMDALSVYGYKRVDSRAVWVSFLLLHLSSN